jgi:hypothetical protein
MLFLHRQTHYGLGTSIVASVILEMMACQDCLFYVANSDEPEDRDIEADIVAETGYHSGRMACGDSDKDHEFSWSACECCGSRLGGSRHHLVLLGD